MSSQPSVAILILNYNGRHHLEAFLPSVLAASYANKTVWVVDNKSTDDSCTWLRQHYPEVHLLEVPSNRGFVGGYNFGFEHVHDDYVLLLNNDVRVTPNFIEPVISMMEADPGLAAVQSRLRNVQNPQAFDYAGAAGGYIDALGYPFCRGRLLETVELDEGQYNDDHYRLFWATGGCMFIRSSLYKQLQGMYSYLFMQNEDIDLCWRLQLHGYRIGYCADSIVYHVGGGSISWETPQKIFLTFKNNLVVITRNMPVSRLLWLIPLRLALDSAAAVRYLVLRRPGHGWAIWRAIGAYLHWLFFISRYSANGEHKWPGKRGLLQCDGVYRGAIVWQYFVRGKRKFTDLYPKSK